MDPITLFIVNLLIGVALSVGSSLLQNALAPKASNDAAKYGIRGTLTVGGDEPLSIMVGHYGTAGHLEYVGTWGNDGETPNAYLTHVISVSDLPVRGLSGLFVNGVRVTIDATPTEGLGYPVLEYRTADGVDHLWIVASYGFADSVDPFLLEKFGTHPTRPWTSDMIGRGIAWFRVTALINRELFNGLPDYFFEINGLDLADPRDGEASQNNPIVLIHQILNGISYDGAWLWGPQGLPATRLPADVWTAQMDKCDAPIALAAGGTEPRFRIGAEIRVDQQPIDVIQQLLDSCNGRIAEIGGIYKVLVAEPGDPVKSFADEDIVITEGQSFDPFPGLEDTFNGINATYVEPVEKWSSKDAPPLRDAGMEADDDGRLLPADVSFPLVYSGTQVQRLMTAMLQEDRRFRQHTSTMPPEWWEFEVLDAVTWTSQRNGYENKVFLITTMDDLPTGNQFIGLKEQDPNDYSWSTDDELGYEVIPPVSARPPAQLMTGWTAVGDILYDAANNARRPTIRVGYDGGLDDVKSVRVQVREGWGDKRLVFDGEHPYDKAVASPSKLLDGQFLPLTEYEVRGKYVPFGPRATFWSNQDEDGTEGEWLGVTTPDVRLGGWDLYEGALGFSHLQADLKELLNWVGDGVREAIDTIQQAALRTVDQDADQYTNIQRSRTELKSATGAITAAYTLAITTATGPGSAMAQRIETIEATIPDLATATAVNAVTTRVSNTENGLTAAVDAINSIGVSLNGKADASVVTATNAAVSNLNGVVNSQATLLTQLTATVNDTSAQANLRATVNAGPTGYSARIGFEARTGGAGAWRAASFFLDVPASTSSPTRAAIVADQFVVANQAQVSGAAVFAPFIVQGGVVYMDTARIRDLTVDNIKFANGSVGTGFGVQLSGITGSVNPSATVGVVGVDTTSRGGSNDVRAGGTVTTNGLDPNKFGGVIVSLRRAGSTVMSQYGYVDDDQQKDFNFSFDLLDKSAPGTSAAPGALRYELWIQRVASAGGWFGGEGSGVLYVKDWTLNVTNQSKINAS